MKEKKETFDIKIITFYRYRVDWCGYYIIDKYRFICPYI